MRSLADLTTLHVGGTPRALTIATDESQIIAVVQSASSDVLILGGGSNLVVSDNFNGEVIKIESTGFENDESACAHGLTAIKQCSKTNSESDCRS